MIKMLLNNKQAESTKILNVYRILEDCDNYTGCLRDKKSKKILKQIDYNQCLFNLKNYLEQISIDKDDFYRFDIDLLYNSESHGLPHAERVLILGTVIAHGENLNLKDYNILISALKYHDIGRINDEEDKYHGERSANLVIKSEKSDTLDGFLLYQIIKMHSYDDHETQAEYDKLKMNFSIRKRLNKLDYILKDADALDRVRLDTGLDPNYLRTKTARKLIGFAHYLYNDFQKMILN